MPNWKKLIVSGSDANLSSLTIDGALTASSAYLESASIGHLQTIYETASVIYSSGSTKFGDTLDDTHEITGSLLVTGSITGDLTGTASIANFSTTASQADNATTASHIVTASFADSSTTASFAVTASYALNAAGGGGGGGGGVGATNAQTISTDLHVSQSENLMLITPFEVADGTTITVENDAFLYAFSEIPTPTLVDSASVAISASYASNATNATSASYLSNKKQLVSIESSDLTASLYTTHLITSPLSMSAPTSPTEGDWFKVSQRVPSGSNFTSSLLFGNGSQIMETSTELELDVEDQGLEFIYSNATQGWIIIGN